MGGVVGIGGGAVFKNNAGGGEFAVGVSDPGLVPNADLHAGAVETVGCALVAQQVGAGGNGGVDVHGRAVEGRVAAEIIEDGDLLVWPLDADGDAEALGFREGGLVLCFLHFGHAGDDEGAHYRITEVGIAQQVGGSFGVGVAGGEFV